MIEPHSTVNLSAKLRCIKSDIDVFRISSSVTVPFGNSTKSLSVMFYIILLHAFVLGVGMCLLNSCIANIHLKLGGLTQVHHGTFKTSSSFVFTYFSNPPRPTTLVTHIPRHRNHPNLLFPDRTKWPWPPHLWMPILNGIQRCQNEEFWPLWKAASNPYLKHEAANTCSALKKYVKTKNEKS